MAIMTTTPDRVKDGWSGAEDYPPYAADRASLSALYAA